METEWKLPEPQRNLDFPLMRALELRRTRRKWNNSAISNQELSNLLWAACGITVEGTSRCKCKRTVPSARNAQTIKVYVALHKGLFLYNEEQHSLFPILTADIREHIETQRMMKSAPVGLIYVSDFSKLKGYIGTNETRKLFVAGTETGFISQNVYLYCAAANLNTAILGLVNREKLHSIMQLKDSEQVIYTQAIGKAL
ncbi:MAG: nitroreductase family protein [Bacteroidales bacterium]